MLLSKAASTTGWTRVAFGDVAQLVRARSADPEGDGFERYVGLEHIDPEDITIRSWGRVSEGTTFTNVFRAGQVLFGKRRAYQRKVAVAHFDGVCSGDIYVFEPKGDGLLSSFLPFICQTDRFFEHAVGTSAGSLSPRTNWDSLAEFEFSLPPLHEQERLVALLGSVLDVEEALRNAHGRLQRARAALAAHYFGDQHDDYNTTTCADLIESDALSLQTGPFGTVLRASAYTKTGHPVINPVDMSEGHIVIDHAARIGDEDWRRLEKYWMRPGDMLLGRKRHMRNLVRVLPAHDGYVVGSDCIRFRVDSVRISPKYFFHFLRSESTQRWLQAQAGGNGSVMPGMNEEIIGRLTIALPQMAKQDEVGAVLDEWTKAETAVIQRRQAARSCRMKVFASAEGQTQ